MGGPCRHQTLETNRPMSVSSILAPASPMAAAGTMSPLGDHRHSRRHEPAPIPRLRVGRVVDVVSDLITPTRAQLRPVPESNSAIQSEHLLAFGAPDRRMALLPDIEKLMATAETGSVGHLQ